MWEILDLKKNQIYEISQILRENNKNWISQGNCKKEYLTEKNWWMDRVFGYNQLNFN